MRATSAVEIEPQGAARIFDRFLATCRARPNARAIVHADGAWTYAQVERASAALAIQLLAQPADDKVVALYARRSGELVIGMLACLRAGLTFAVLDAAYPVARLEQLLDVLQPGRMVALGATAADEEVLAQLAIQQATLRIDGAHLSELLRAEHRRDARLDGVSADAIGYLLFTSGTTGVPKCIATTHAPLVHFIDWYEKAFAVDPQCRFSMLSGVAHDPILRDVFVPLSTGAEIHVPPQASVLDPAKLHAWMTDARVTHTHVTPQLCRILCAGSGGKERLAALKYLFSGGDTLRTRQAAEVVAMAPRARVVNFYGCTETPQAMGYHVFTPSLDEGFDVVPVGRGIDDVQLLVVDGGQIAIRTRFLSEGYRGDNGLTTAKFVAAPDAQDPADRLYLTGDVGHVRPDGAIVVDGRLDDQVKVRGFRVELSDVVHHLERIAVVKEAVVLSERAPDGESRLVAYLIARPGVPADSQATALVRDAITAAAPAYMVPSRFAWLDRFPLLPNGKLDRAELKTLGALPEPGADISPPLDAIEASIVAEWRALLALPAIDPARSFVDLGGDSLSFVTAAMHLEILLGALPEGWEKLSIRELARKQQVKRSRWTSIDASVFVRAVSIVSVVVGHFDFPDFVGSVRALFVVSGMSFGRYLVPQVLRTESVSPIARLVAKIVIPTILYTLVVNTMFGTPTLPGLFLINNLVSPDSHVGGVGFWFIDVLVQCFVIFAALLAVPWVRRLVERDPFQFALSATIVLAGIAHLAGRAWDTSHLFDRVPQYHLGAMFLGWALIHATSVRRKLAVMAAAALTFGDAASAAWHHHDILFFPFVATLFLIYVGRVSLPRHLGRLVTALASASLFIYLMDHQVQWALTKAGLASLGLGMVLVALVVGIGARGAWQRISVLTSRFLMPR